MVYFWSVISWYVKPPKQCLCYNDILSANFVICMDTLQLSEPSTRTPSRASEKGKLGSESDASTISEDAETQSLRKVDAEGEPEINEVDVEFAEYPDDCFCNVFKRNCACCTKVEQSSFGVAWWKFRCAAFKMTQHRYFETFIITMIVTSSLALVSIAGLIRALIVRSRLLWTRNFPQSKYSWTLLYWRDIHFDLNRRWFENPEDIFIWWRGPYDKVLACRQKTYLHNVRLAKTDQPPY